MRRGHGKTPGARCRGRAVVLGTALLALACGSEAPQLDVEHEATRISALTLPPGASRRRGLPIERSEYRVVSQWTFETGLGWDEYLRWLETSLPATYERREARERRARFVRVLPGDLFTLELERMSEHAPMHVAARFTAQAF